MNAYMYKLCIESGFSNTLDIFKALIAGCNRDVRISVISWQSYIHFDLRILHVVGNTRGTTAYLQFLNFKL